MTKKSPLMLLGWLLLVCLPPTLFVVLQASVDLQIALFSAISVSVLLMWMFSLLTDFVPALLGLLAILLFGLAPTEVVLSGFSSPAFLLAFSIMGLGAVIVESGLAQRYTLMLLKHLPENTFFYQLALMLTGLAFTPIVPTIVGRAAIVGPVLSHLHADLHETTQRRSSTMLYASGLNSIHYLAPWFLTAAPANLMIYALLPAQEQQAYGFVFWALAASLASLIMLFGFFLVSFALFSKSYCQVRVPHARIAEKLTQMGRLSRNENIALLAIGLLALAIFTQPLHKIGIEVVAFSILALLLYMGALTRNRFIAAIDWAFLSLLAALIGILATMKHLGIQAILIDKLDWVADYMQQDFMLFVLLLSLVLLLVRLIIPLNQAILIFAAALIPIASHAGIAPWVVGFIILVIAETAFFAYQSPYIFMFRNLTSDIQRNESKVRLLHLMLIPVKLLAIYLSIPFWQALGIL